MLENADYSVVSKSYPLKLLKIDIHWITLIPFYVTLRSYKIDKILFISLEEKFIKFIKLN